MLFVFGGAYQGAEDYALEITGEERILTLDESMHEIDFSARVIAGLDKFVLGCVRRGESAGEYFAAHAEEWQHCALVGVDFSCGVVPMDAELRLWREENGRLNNYLSGKADRVVRMFCGIAQVLK